MEPEVTEQELIAANVKNAEKALKTMDDLDKIKVPLECTIYMANQRSTYRNDAYRRMVAEMDIQTKNNLKMFVKDKSPRLMDKIFRRNGQ